MIRVHVNRYTIVHFTGSRSSLLYTSSLKLTVKEGQKVFIVHLTYGNGKRAEDAPRDLPVDENSAACHQMNVTTEPLTACQKSAILLK